MSLISLKIKIGTASIGEANINQITSSLGQCKNSNLIENAIRRTRMTKIESTNIITNCFVIRLRLVNLFLKNLINISFF